MLPLKAWLVLVTEPLVVIIDAMAMTLIAGATGLVFVHAVKLGLRGQPTNAQRRGLWLEYSRWLIAGLTMQLAADIIESSLYTNWDRIGQLAAIAAIRTFLNYFLERDIREVRERQRERPSST